MAWTKCLHEAISSSGQEGSSFWQPLAWARRCYLQPVCTRDFALLVSPCTIPSGSPAAGWGPSPLPVPRLADAHRMAEAGRERPCGSDHNTSSVFLQSSGVSTKNPCERGADAAQGGTFRLKIGQAQRSQHLKTTGSLKKSSTGCCIAVTPWLPGLAASGDGAFPQHFGEGSGPELGAHGCAAPRPIMKPQNIVVSLVVVGRGQCLAEDSI